MTLLHDNPYERTVRDSEPRRWSVSWIELLVVVSIVATAASFFVSPSNERCVSFRMVCLNNVKQIELALYQYHDRYGTFPPAVVAGADGEAAHSWRVLILPFLDEYALYDRYDFSEPWCGPGNIQLQDSMPGVYRCPLFLRDVEPDSPSYVQRSRLTNYMAVVSPDSVFNDTAATSRKEVTDGLGNTIMISEIHEHAVHWMSPVDVTPSQLLRDLRSTVNTPSGRHPGCTIVGFADGSARTIRPDIDELTFRGLVTIDGGEEVDSHF